MRVLHVINNLRREGAQVQLFNQVTAANGDEAIACMERASFDVVVTDLSMPGKSGFDVARAVKAGCRPVPVVLLSGWAVQHDDDDVRQAGIDRVLVKPCQIDTLLSTVAELGAND